MTEYDPRLVAPACLYLASKVEESTVQARLLVFYIKKMCGESPDHIDRPMLTWKAGRAAQPTNHLFSFP